MTNSAKTSPPLSKTANAAAQTPRGGGGGGGGPLGPLGARRGSAEELSDKASSASAVGATSASGVGGDASSTASDGGGAWWDLGHFAAVYSQPVALGAVLLLGLCVGLLVGTRRAVSRSGLLGGHAYRQLGAPSVESWHWPVA